MTTIAKENSPNNVSYNSTTKHQSLEMCVVKLKLLRDDLYLSISCCGEALTIQCRAAKFQKMRCG